MQTKKLLTAAFVAIVGLAAAAPLAEAAWVTNFKGTRDQVRSACKAVGGETLEGANSTICFNDKNQTGVECNDDGNCSGSGPRTATVGTTRPVLGPLGVLTAGQ